MTTSKPDVQALIEEARLLLSDSEIGNRTSRNILIGRMATALSALSGEAEIEWMHEARFGRKVFGVTESIDYVAGMDAQAKRMPSEGLVALTVKRVIEGEMQYDDDDYGRIASAVMALWEVVV